MNEEKATEPAVRTEAEERISELLVIIDKLIPTSPERATELLFRLCRILYPTLSDSTKELLRQHDFCPNKDSIEQNIEK